MFVHILNIGVSLFFHWQLLVGDFGLSYNQQKIQMALWSIMASPLLVSADLRHITNKSKSILLNRLALNISQDPLGIMGSQIDNVSDHNGAEALFTLRVEVKWSPSHSIHNVKI